MASELPRLSPAGIVARDQHLLEAGTATGAVAILSVAGLTLGVGQADRNPTARRARDLGLPVVRRSTGGTGVLSQAGDLAWSIVLPRDDPRVGRDYVRAYGRLGAAISDELSARGHPATWEAAPGLAPELCVLSSRGQVLRAGRRIIGGAAQHLTARALLHHGFLARTVDRVRMAAIFDVPRPVLDRELGGWEELGLSVSAEELGTALLRRFAASLPRTD